MPSVTRILPGLSPASASASWRSAGGVMGLLSAKSGSPSAAWDGDLVDIASIEDLDESSLSVAIPSRTEELPPDPEPAQLRAARPAVAEIRRAVRPGEHKSLPDASQTRRLSRGRLGDTARLPGRPDSLTRMAVFSGMLYRE